MDGIPAPPWAPRYLHENHAGSVAALGPDARAFFKAHGYDCARLARRNRVSGSMMRLFFGGHACSGRLVRNLAKLRTHLEAHDAQRYRKLLGGGRGS